MQTKLRAEIMSQVNRNKLGKAKKNLKRIKMAVLFK